MFCVLFLFVFLRNKVSNLNSRHFNKVTEESSEKVYKIKTRNTYERTHLKDHLSSVFIFFKVLQIFCLNIWYGQLRNKIRKGCESTILFLQLFVYFSSRLLLLYTWSARLRRARNKFTTKLRKRNDGITKPNWVLQSRLWQGKKFYWNIATTTLLQLSVNEDWKVNWPSSTRVSGRKLSSCVI